MAPQRATGTTTSETTGRADKGLTDTAGATSARVPGEFPDRPAASGQSGPPGSARSHKSGSGDLVRALALAATAVTQVISAPVTLAVLGPSADNGAISDANASPITPAGYAFSIWGLIYTACLALAVYQLLPSQRGRVVHRRSGWWLVAAFAASTIWLPIFGSRTLGLAQIVIFALVGALAMATIRLSRSGPADTWKERLLLRLPVTLYLGWATLASVAGMGTTLRWLGMPERAGWVIALSVAMLLGAGVLAALVIGRETAVAGFAFTACWALIAIGVATESTAVRVVCLMITFVLVAVTTVRAVQSRRADQVLFG